MIKTKEDLIGRYAVRADKEVFELFMQKCEEFGIKWHGDCEPRRVVYGLAVGYDGEDLTHGAEHHFADSQRLTLADFKPIKTRTEYKPVTMRDFEALKEFREGKDFYHKPEYVKNYHLVTNAQTLIQAHVSGWLYTKEEVELDWRDVAAECLGVEMFIIDEAGYYCSGGQYLCLKGKHVDALLRSKTTIDQFLRMCHEVAEITEKPE